MRKILFKAKRIDNGAWIQGYLFKSWERAYILWGTTNDIPNTVEVDHATVCQDTGLTDKNGVKIFEGDILRLKYNILSESIATVYFDTAHARFIGVLEDGTYETFIGVPSEVIGSIHDTLKGE